MKKGFTLIESLAVIVIIGILASMTVVVVGQAQQRGRDAKRKSDLTAISLAFQARYESKVCGNASEVGFYPGRDLIGTGGRENRWQNTQQLIKDSECGGFSEYMVTIPTDPSRGSGEDNYRFDLSVEFGSLVGKHYRLAAKLERPLTSQEAQELGRISTLWENTFGGGTVPSGYTYITGK